MQFIRFKFLVLLLPVLLLAGCKNFKGYTISGDIKNADKQTVYLEDLASDGLAVVDTTTLENGKFQLKNYTTKGLYRLRIGERGAIFLYLDEKDKIALTGDLNDLNRYTVSGSEASQVIQNLVLEVDRRLRGLDSLYQVSQLAPETDRPQWEAQLAQSQSQYVGYIKSFVSQTENKEVAAFALSFLGPAIQTEIPYLVAITDSLHQAEPNSKFINRLYTSLQQYRDQLLGNQQQGIGIGAQAPNIVLADPNGDTIQLKDLQGKVVLLDFWASWCGPCRQENPNVVKLYKQFHPKGLEIFSVSLDSNESPWKKAIKTDGLIWPWHGSDFGGWNSKPARDYHVESIPQTYLLDKSGKIIGKNLRGLALEEKLAEIFADTSSVQ